jgi:PKD repeat protein
LPPTASFTATPATGLAPLAVQLTDTSTNGPTTWQWDFGDGGTSTIRSPSHTFAAGTYTITLTATNTNGSSTTTRTVTAIAPQPPVASFTANPTLGTAPLAVQLTDTSANGPTSWLWDFGDGGTSASQSPTHTFGAVGTYTVTLTATNALGSTTASTTITASDPPNSVLPTKDSYVSSGSATKNYGSYVDLRALAGSTQYRPYLSFNVSGLGAPVARAVLRLYVTDASTSGGDWYAVDPSWNESSLNWNNAPPIGGALLSSLGAVSANTWVEVDVTPAVAGNGSYSFAALTTSTNSLKYSSKEGLNPPQLVLTPGNSSAPPVAAFTASTTSGAAPLDVAFTDASTANATSWAWDFGDGGTATGQNPSHTFNQVGSFVVRLTAGNANGSTSATRTITTTAPTTNGTFPATKDSIVSRGSPTKNYGTYDYIRGLLSLPDEYRPYVSFDVSGVTGPVTRAVIRLYVTDGSDNGGAWYPVDASAWTESGLNWGNAPLLTGTPVATLGTVGAGGWIEVDVTSAVTGNGSYSFGGISTSANSVRYSSKEGLNPPQLVVTTA